VRFSEANKPMATHVSLICAKVFRQVSFGSLSEWSHGSETQTCFVSATWVKEPHEPRNNKFWREFEMSLECLHTGYFPLAPFAGEEFQKGSWRYEMRGGPGHMDFSEFLMFYFPMCQCALAYTI